MATKYSARFAGSYQLSKYLVGFIVVAFISILPETFVFVSAAIQGIPSFGLGTLFGSNIADLSLVFSILIIYAGRGMKIESKVLKNVTFYPFFILLPVVLGLNGHYSRLEGFMLILAGMFFYYFVFKNNVESSKNIGSRKDGILNILMLVFSMAILLIGSHFVVRSASDLAAGLGINAIFIGLFVVGLGTVVPELLFSLKSIAKKEDDLAAGDILGTALADATIVVGILALINPFNFPIKIVYITGIFMFAASIILIKFMRSGKVLTKKEGYLLFAFWASYVVIEILLNNKI